MKRWLDFAWRWSIAVTLPVALVFAWWAIGTFQQWRAFSVDYDAAPVQVDLLDVGTDRWRHLVRSLRIALSPRTLASVPEERSLRTVQLFIAASDLDWLGRDLPYSGYEFVPGRLMYGDGLHEVKVRYRGDFLAHWGYDKKSIRIRTKVDDLYEGMRAFNLIVPKFPEQVNNYLGYRLAEYLGLLAPRCELVNVFLNGRNLGLHEFTEQLDEGTLRRADRMPGDIYAGELVAKDRIEGVTNNVFELPELWEKVAANHHYDLADKTPLETLLRLLNESPSEATEARLGELLDMRAFGAFGAYELLTQTHHFDECHNWRLYWDPWALKFQPIVWDPTPWAPEMRPPDGGPVALDLVISRLAIWLCRNGDFLAARHAALRDFFATGKVARFLAEVDWALTAAREALAFDPNVRPTDPQAVASGMVDFRAFIDQTFRELRLCYLEQAGTLRHTAPDATGTLALEVTGRQPVDEVVLRFEQPIKAVAAAVLQYRRGSHVEQVDLGGGTIAQGNTLRVPARLLAQLAPSFQFRQGQILREHTLREVPGYYELRLPGLPADNRLMEVLARRSGRLERALPATTLAPRDLEWLYVPATAMPARVPQLWRGEVAVHDVRTITDDVVIEPGTTVRLDPGASVLFRGRVTAIGDAERPIRFVPAAAERGPWGTVALNGAGCSGSTFRCCELRGGSGHKEPMQEYTAMFSLHNCADVRVEDCVFADNFAVDDLIHLAYADVLFDRVELRHAAKGALDADISHVVVRNSRFIDCGNDGIDLMTTAAVVADCRFENNRDQGIALGEASRLLAVRDTFDGCGKAMAARDGSFAQAANCEIRRCERALHAHHENRRYDAGGSMIVRKSVFAANRSMPTADARSTLVLQDCQVDAPDAPTFESGDKQPVKVKNRARAIDCSASAAVQSRQPLPFPEELRPLEALAGAVWDTVRADVRGGARDQ